MKCTNLPKISPESQPDRWSRLPVGDNTLLAEGCRLQGCAYGWRDEPEHGVPGAVEDPLHDPRGVVSW